MKKRPHLRAKVQRVLTMKPDSVGTIINLVTVLLQLKSFFLDSTMIIIIFGIPHPSNIHNSALRLFLLVKKLRF